MLTIQEIFSSENHKKLFLKWMCKLFLTSLILFSSFYWTRMFSTLKNVKVGRHCDWKIQELGSKSAHSWKQCLIKTIGQVARALGQEKGHFNSTESTESTLPAIETDMIVKLISHSPLIFLVMPVSYGKFSKR